MTLARRLVAEMLGTALLLAAVVGSGIMGERLSGGNVAIALLANTVATGAALVALILTFGPISGAHLNPAVTMVEALHGALPWRDAAMYVTLQVAGAFAGVAAAHLMFGEALFTASSHVRSVEHKCSASSWRPSGSCRSLADVREFAPRRFHLPLARILPPPTGLPHPLRLLTRL